MREGGISLVSGNSLETFPAEARNGTAKLVQLLRGSIFRNRVSALHHLVQPVKEPLHRQPVLQMSLPHALYLYLVLNGLAESDG